MFERFPSLTRFSHGWTVTEKLDGTNACVLIRMNEDAQPSQVAEVDYEGNYFTVFAQSRNKLITPEADNAGFARFVADNAKALVETLGEGRHFGEWVGHGIQRNYGLSYKFFALFNAARWTGVVLPERVGVVPVLAEGYMGEPGKEFEWVMEELKTNGSVFAPGFMNPEGIVMRHGPSGTLFKKTFDYDEQGKWAENQARKENSND